MTIPRLIAASAPANHLGAIPGAAIGCVLGLLVGTTVVVLYTSSVNYNRRMIARVIAGAKYRRSEIMMWIGVIVPAVVGAVIGGFLAS